MTAIMNALQELIPINLLFESPSNPRKTFNADSLTGLAESIKRLGLIKPLLVRKKKQGYEVICGARRYRASKMAGLSDLPCRVTELDDEMVLEVQLVENTEREDVHPLEEAESYNKLKNLRKWTITQLAERVKKDAGYIAKRISLLNLIDPIRKAFQEEWILIGHAEALARLNPDQQILAWKEAMHSHDHVSGKQILRARTVRDLNRWIADQILLNLASAPWKKDDAELVPKAGACTVCPKRTGANTELFDDFKKTDHCLDRDCFLGKRIAFVKSVVSEMGLNPPYYLFGEHCQFEERKFLERTFPGILDRYNYQEAEEKKCDSNVLAVIVNGSKVGKTLSICVNKACKIHYRTYGGSTPEIRWRERERKVKESIRVEINQRVWSELANVTTIKMDHEMKTMVAARMLERTHHDQAVAIGKALDIAPALVSKPYKHKDYRGPLVKHMQSLKGNQLDSFIIAMSFANALTFGEAKDLKQFAKKNGIKVAAIESKITNERMGKFKTARTKALQKAKQPKKPTTKKS